MATQHWLKLTKTEAEHLLTLINRNEVEGTYYSPENQYWNRSNRIKIKLREITKTSETTPSKQF
jgi:hypothetical protein